MAPKKKVNKTEKDSTLKKKVRIDEKREDCLEQEKVEEAGVVSENNSGSCVCLDNVLTSTHSVTDSSEMLSNTTLFGDCISETVVPRNLPVSNMATNKSLVMSLTTLVERLAKDSEERMQEKREAKKNAEVLEAVRNEKQETMELNKKMQIKRYEDRAYIKYISKMRGNDDVETFLEALELSLLLGNVDIDLWKQILTSKITSANLVHVSELIQDPSATCETVKDRIILAAGRNPTQAGIDFLNRCLPDSKTSCPNQSITQVKKSLQSVLRGAETLPDCENRLMIAKIRSRLPKKGQLLLDSMCPTNKQGLRDALAVWKASNGFLFQDSCKTDIKPKSKFEAKCFKCGKIGHRAPECRVRFFNEKVGESGRSVEVTCYKCGVKSHKAN